MRPRSRVSKKRGAKASAGAEAPLARPLDCGTGVGGDVPAAHAAGCGISRVLASRNIAVNPPNDREGGLISPRCGNSHDALAVFALHDSQLATMGGPGRWRRRAFARGAIRARRQSLPVHARDGHGDAASRASRGLQGRVRSRYLRRHRAARRCERLGAGVSAPRVAAEHRSAALWAAKRSSGQPFATVRQACARLPRPGLHPLRALPGLSRGAAGRRFLLRIARRFLPCGSS